MMALLFLFIGALLGFVVMGLCVATLLVGKLKVTTDPTDGQHYTFLELSRPDVLKTFKHNYVVLKIDWDDSTSRK